MATKAAAKKAGLVVAGPPQVFYRINSLLYTLRTIAQREDQLCMLMHHVRTSGRLTSALSAELQEILEDIPAAEYMHDLEALRASLGGVGERAATRLRARSGSKRRAA